MIGDVVGNFKIVAQLGRGGMGEVFRAEQINVGTRVAIKMLTSELSTDADYVQRLFNEARAVGRIRHGGVVQIFDVGTTAQGRAYLVMEMLDGETLRRVLARGRLPLRQICDLGRQLASILEATHAAGITHRDLKPDNIYLVPDPQMPSGTRVKVLDFGIAKLTGTLQGHSPLTHGTMGTPAYMAPEQWGPPTGVDHRVDLYSLGCVLFEMVTGRVPFMVSSMAEACRAHTDEDPPRASSLLPEKTISGSLDDLLAALLAKDPQARPTTRAVMTVLERNAAELEGVADPLATMSTQLPVATSLPARQEAATGRASKRPLVVVALLLAAIAAIGIVVALGSKTQKPLPDPGSGSGSGPGSVAGTLSDAPAPIVAPSGATDGAIADAEDTFADFMAWFDAENPWVTDHDVPIRASCVHRHQYLRWVSLQRTTDQGGAKPLFRAATDGDTGPVTWVTYEQAAKFCKQTGGRLPTSEMWEQLEAFKNGGVNPCGLRFWTSTIDASGKAIVRGMFTELPVDHPSNMKPWIQRWDTEASNGGLREIEKVASRQIGFRCAR